MIEKYLKLTEFSNYIGNCCSFNLIDRFHVNSLGQQEENTSGISKTAKKENENSY